MTLSLKETQAIIKMADILYRFLPANPNPYAHKEISFPGVANSLGLIKFWPGGSKKPAITLLLQRTLEYERERFCDLLIGIINTGNIYLSKKNEPITREEMVELNQIITEVSFKIPELWDPTFLETLPSSSHIKSVEVNEQFINRTEKLRNQLSDLEKLEPQERGFAFERFLNELFICYDLNPRSSFKLIGEQIDGSFQIGTDIYLVEAKWQGKQIDQSDLLVFREKVESKSTWGRGIFISYNGFTREGLEAFSKGRATNIIGMDSQDIFFVLSGEMSLTQAINIKARRAAETGEFFQSVYLLSRGG